MAQQIRSKKILLVGDSRLRHLDTILNSMDPNFAFISKCLPGARLNRIIANVKETLLENNTFSLIIILGGINDITKIDSRALWLIKTRFDTVTETVTYVNTEIKDGLVTLQASTQIPVVFCPIVGLDLTVYSPTNTEASLQQPIINQAVKQINQFIYAVNTSNHVPTPLLESTIHKCKGKSRTTYINHYSKLEDGCHPSPATRSQWASIIYKSTHKFLEL